MKTVIEMAREAGFVVCRDESVLREMLERFAELVRADEREACAKVCDDFETIAHSDDVAYGSQENSLYYGMAVGAENCAAAIRARSNT